MWVEDPVLKSTVFQRHRKPQGRMELLREGVWLWKRQEGS